MSTERTQRTITVWDRCTCGKVLHSLSEAQRGTCSSCWLKSMPSDTKAALNQLLTLAFKPTSDEEKGKRVEVAFEKLARDERSRATDNPTTQGEPD